MIILEDEEGVMKIISNPVEFQVKGNHVGRRVNCQKLIKTLYLI